MIKFPFFFLDFKNFHTLFCMYMYFIQYSRFTQNDTSTRDRYFYFTNLSRQQLKHFWHSLFMSHTFRGSIFALMLFASFISVSLFFTLYRSLSFLAGSCFWLFFMSLLFCLLKSKVLLLLLLWWWYSFGSLTFCFYRNFPNQ